MEEMEWPTEGQGWEGSTEEGSGADTEEEEEEMQDDVYRAGLGSIQNKIPSAEDTPPITGAKWFQIMEEDGEESEESPTEADQAGNTPKQSTAKGNPSEKKVSVTMAQKLVTSPATV